MYKSKLDMDENSRNQVITLCSARLADSIDLVMQTKQAHWNVKGPQFISLHKLFDEVFEHCIDWMDLIGERIVQLGGRADAVISVAAEKSTLPDYPLDIVEGPEHVENLSNSLAQYSASVKQAIDLCTDSGDAATADIFTEIARAVDMDLWFIEAHAFGRDITGKVTGIRGEIPESAQATMASARRSRSENVRAGRVGQSGRSGSMARSRALKKGDRAHSSARANRNQASS